jgi:large subunit ribosomal protein L18
MQVKTRRTERDKRHDRLRRRIDGGAERPRLSVFKSHKNYYVQVIDDVAGRTIASASTLEPEVKQQLTARGNLSAAKAVGALLAKRSLAKGVSQVVFDRGGNHYHGAVKALADAARESGLKF